MRETDFIGQNKEKWVDFERTLSNKQADPDDLSKLFIEATDDLSFSRTYYPTRSVGEYLNSLAQKVYRSIYNNRKKEKGSLARFWFQEIPDAMWESRKGLLVSFIVFLVGSVIGILSTHHNPEFPSIILSEAYVEMTEQNINQDNPMAVYQQMDAVSMFIEIAWNNIRVVMFCFVLGLLFQVGSLFFILYNSIMFGSFMWFFVQRGLLQESFLAVMLHGTIELSMIIIAGAAGVALGKGLVFPGNFSRLQAMTKSARHASKIIIAVAVFLVLAAFIEGFLTRYSVVENSNGQLVLDVFRGLFILLSGILVVGYFIVLPWYRYSKGRIQKGEHHETLFLDEEVELKHNIKSTSEINDFTWKTFFQILPPIGGVNILLTTAISVGLALLLDEFSYLSIFDADTLSSGEEGLFDAMWPFDEINDFFQFTKYPILLCFVY
ncbi:MAG: stage II sporulation protein M, partial [Flavobacteriales bacterium]